PDAAAAEGEDDIDEEDEAPAIDSLKESEGEGTVVLFGDADFLFDSFAVRIQNFLGTRMLSLLNGNLPVAQNVVEQLAGDNRLIRVRSRAAMNRPFTTIRDMQIQAEKEYRSKIQGLEDTLQQTQTKLSELQSQRTDVSQGQRFVLSDDQQKELEKFRKQQVDTNKQLKTMRRDLRKDIDALETKLKWVNIAGMPFIITIGGILIATIKRKRTAAR
ncbi:MAG: ABC transporter, partial [Verrucomicrobia bacterium]|nr:ABC transporter [Verrucomicrobiota bacterium]